MTSYTLAGITTFMMILGFLGLCVWAYSSRRKPDFDKMAHLPLDDDLPEACQTQDQKK